MQTKQSLGVDIGNVIINHRLAKTDDETFYEEQYSTIPCTEGAFEALKKLNEFFNGEVYLISKCTEWAEEKILAWFVDNDFYNHTGIKQENVYFVRKRDEKDLLCQTLGITHFIDDRLEVLSYMIESTSNLYLFQPDEAELKLFEKFLPKVNVVGGWEEVLNSIIK